MNEISGDIISCIATWLEYRDVASLASINHGIRRMCLKYIASHRECVSFFHAFCGPLEMTYQANSIFAKRVVNHNNVCVLDYFYNRKLFLNTETRLMENIRILSNIAIKQKKYTSIEWCISKMINKLPISACFKHSSITLIAKLPLARIQKFLHLQGDMHPDIIYNYWIMNKDRPYSLTQSFWYDIAKTYDYEKIIYVDKYLTDRLNVNMSIIYKYQYNNDFNYGDRIFNKFCKAGRVDLMRYHYNKYTDMLQINNHGDYAFSLAVESGNLDAVKYIYEISQKPLRLPLGFTIKPSIAAYIAENYNDTYLPFFV